MADMKVTVDYNTMDYGRFPHKHAQTVIAELGITYKKSMPDSMADNWKFYGCENIPDNFPPYVTIREMSEWDYEFSGMSRGG